MSEQPSDSNPRGALSGILITLISAGMATLFFAAFFTLAYIKHMPYGRPQAMILQVTAIAFTVILTLFLSRKVQGDKLSYMQGFLGGWMASLVLALFVSAFYSVFSSITKTPTMPKGGFAMVVMLYSAIGMLFSLAAAMIFKKD
ncbi:MAG: hypothetical protein U0U67_07755 [Chitinophagales bacterium]